MAVASITPDAIAMGPAHLPAILKRFVPLAAVPAPWPSTLRMLVKSLPPANVVVRMPIEESQLLGKGAAAASVATLVASCAAPEAVLKP